jgi:AcrR family transcriptional regulator
LTGKHKVNIVNIIPGRKKKPYHHGDLRRALVTAALAAVAEDGADKFTLRDVARRAGVSVAAPYRHFRDKEALLAAVAAECALELGKAMDAAVAAAPPDPLERFRATGIAYVRFAVENPRHFRAINLPGILAHLPRDVRGDVDKWKQCERDRLADAHARGLVGGGSIDQILLAANCLMHGLACQIVDGQIPPERGEQLAWVITEVFGAGIIPRSG